MNKKSFDLWDDLNFDEQNRVLKFGKIRKPKFTLNPIAFLIGYFVVMSPINYTIGGSLIHGLITAIIGVGLTIVLEVIDNVIKY